MNIASILATKGGQLYTVRPDQTVREALGLLAEHNIGALIVIDGGGAPVGILSERDIVRHLAKNERLFTHPVSELMTTSVVTGVPKDDLVSVGATMTEKRIRHLPVMDNGRLVGMISIGDIVKAERNRYQGEVDTLQIQLLESQSGKVV